MIEKKNSNHKIYSANKPNLKIGTKMHHCYIKKFHMVTLVLSHNTHISKSENEEMEQIYKSFKQLHFFNIQIITNKIQ